MNAHSSVITDAQCEHRIGQEHQGSSFLHEQNILIRALDAVFTWQQRARERRALMRLDERALHDLALTRDSADAEASKPFWRS